MSESEWALAVSVFLACAVEAVEALTIILAVGMSRSWRSTICGAVGGAVSLAIIVAALGPAVTRLPENALRIVVGGLLLIFGLQWLRKAILRAAGLRALHDEDEIFRAQSELARSAGGRRDEAIDGYSLAIAFKAVLLEGLEVAFIVITFGANQHRIGLAAIAAVAAIVVVTGGGVAVRAPLARVPENAMKFAVGVLITSFGTFWSAEGAGAHWPGGNAALLILIPGLALISLGMVRRLREAPTTTRALPGTERR